MFVPVLFAAGSDAGLVRAGDPLILAERVWMHCKCLSKMCAVVRALFREDNVARCAEVEEVSGMRR